MAGRPHRIARWSARAGGILQEAGVRWVDDACYRMGASLAFYALFSLFPLLLVAMSLLGVFLGSDPSNRGKLLDSVASVLSAQSRSLLDESLASLQAHDSARGVGALIGTATLVFGASGVFSELYTSLNAVWRVPPPPPAGFWKVLVRAVRDKAIAFSAVAGAGVVLLVSLLVTTALEALGSGPARSLPDAIVWRAIDDVVSLALAMLLFGVVYRVLPRTRVAWRDVRGGALVAAILFVALKYVLAWYLGTVGGYAAYGAVGAVLGLLMWIYVTGLVVFFGAEVTRVYAEREGSLAPRPPGELPGGSR